MTLSMSHNLYFLICKMKELAERRALNQTCAPESDLKHVDAQALSSPQESQSSGAGDKASSAHSRGSG